MQPASRSSNQPLGGNSSDWCYRILRFHVPLALASAVVLVVFMTLPLFGVGGHVDLTSGAFPQQRSGGQTGPMDQGGGQTGPMGHGAGQTSSTRHDAGQTRPMGHGAGQTSSTRHDAGQTESMGPD